MDRLTRLPFHTDTTASIDEISRGTAPDKVDMPFDPETHQWEMICEYDGGYPLEQCFQAAEEILTVNGGQVMRNGAFDALRKRGRVIEYDGFEPQLQSLAIIQLGAQQGIFLATINAQIGEEVEEVNLVVGVARHAALREMIEEDHRTISEARRLEAESMGIDPSSIESYEEATYPMHYDEMVTSSGAYAWVSEFCEGCYETNMFFEDDPSGIPMDDCTERVVFLNGVNLGEPSKILDQDGSLYVRLRTLIHQIRTAALIRKVLIPTFNSGDYLYDPYEDRLMLHCYRDPYTFGAFDGIEELAGELGLDVSDKAFIVAVQMCQAVLFTETNLSDSLGAGKYYTYHPLDIGFIINNLRDYGDEFLTHEEWGTVRRVTQVLSRLILGEADTGLEVMRMNSRMKMIEMSLL